MKKIYSFLFASLLAVSANAQLTTHSTHDVNADGNVTVSDGTEIVDYYVSGRSNSHQVVDAATLNSVLKTIDNKLEKMSDRLTTIEKKVGGGSVNSHNGHEYVDLGTGVKWATMNVGASSPEDYGDYFAWGATQPQSVYYWVDCPYQTQNTDWSVYTKFSKYLGSTTSSYKDSSATDANAMKTIVDPEDDAAHINWGGDWRMPTKAEQNALLSQCYWKWVTSYNGKNVNGYIVYKAKADADKGKRSYYNPSLVGSYSVSDPHIFLPAADWRYSSKLPDPDSSGAYWSSSLYESDPYASRVLAFDSNYVDYSSEDGRLDRRYGLSVRAVCP